MENVGSGLLHLIVVQGVTAMLANQPTLVWLPQESLAAKIETLFGPLGMSEWFLGELEEVWFPLCPFPSDCFGMIVLQPELHLASTGMAVLPSAASGPPGSWEDEVTEHLIH